MSVTILQLSLQNFKGIVEVLEMEPSPTGLTIVGGPNRSGKTSFLNALAYLFGGERFKPSKPWRDGSSTPPHLYAELSNGIIVTRKGKNSHLVVTDPDGKRGNQTLLWEFIDEWALDVGKFMRASPKDKATILLEIIGIAKELAAADALIEKLYGEREIHGRETDQKEKYAAGLEFHKDTPSEETSAVALIEEIRKVDATNRANEDLRGILGKLTEDVAEQQSDMDEWRGGRDEARQSQLDVIKDAEQHVVDAKRELAELDAAQRLASQDECDELGKLEANRKQLEVDVAKLTDQPTDALQEQLAKCEEINARVRDNTTKKVAVAEAKGLRNRYEVYNGEVEDARGARIALFNGAILPYKGLGIKGGEITFNGDEWDCMATCDQYKVAIAIVADKNPECGFALVDRIEALDVDELEDLGTWSKERERPLQLICTRVSEGDECTLILKEGKEVQAETD